MIVHYSINFDNMLLECSCNSASLTQLLLLPRHHEVAPSPHDAAVPLPVQYVLVAAFAAVVLCAKMAALAVVAALELPKP